MKSEDVTSIVVAGFGVAAVVVQRWRATGGTRSVLRSNLEILGQMPASSEAHGRLLKHIEDQVDSMIERDTFMRRDPLGTVLGAVFLIGGVSSLAAGWSSEGVARVLFYLLGGLLITFGAYGLTEGVVKRKRDDKGRVISDE